MTNSSPATADRWAVSTRTSGEVLTAGATLPTIELALLGIPQGFTATEIQSWLRDLAGVAIETSRSDVQMRPIPQLLHHALTGLLFSQTELWSHTGQALPCAAVFVHGVGGVAFGWVGRARVMILLNGEPYEPRWVIVRDEAGNEAMSAMLPANAHVLMTLEYWPQGEDGTQSPASVEAECGVPPQSSTASTPRVAAAARPAATPVIAGVPEPVRASAPAPPAPIADSLPTQQPGLAPDPTVVSLDRPDAAQALPSTHHPSASTFAMSAWPARGAVAPGTPVTPAELEITPNIVPAATGDPRVTPTAATNPPVDADPSSPPGASGIESQSSSVAPERAAPTPPPSVWRPTTSSLPTWPERAGSAGAGDEPGHPVGRWLSRLVDLGRKAIGRAPVPSHTAPVSAYDAMLSSSSAGAQPTRESQPIAPVKNVPRPAAADLDISEPHAMPERAGQVTAPPPAIERPGNRGLAAAGLDDILGAAAGGSQRFEPIRPVEGLTAVSAPTGPLGSSPAIGVRPGSVVPNAPPYPVIDVGSAQPPSRKPIQIEREPLGADTSFSIPRLPAREPAKPARAPAVEPPVTTPVAAVGNSQSAEPAPPPIVRPPAVPEPPADFLAEFAATPWAEGQPAPPRSVGPPPLPADLRSQAPVARVAGLATPVGAPITPETPVVVVRSNPVPAPVLRIPTPADPVVVSASEVPALMRELKLPRSSAVLAHPAGASDVPDGMLVSRPAAIRPPGARSRLTAWPGADELAGGPAPLWRRPWVIGAFIAVLFGIGWLVGHSQAPDNDVHATPMTRVLRTLGIGGARFTATVDTDPPGAWISVDGKEISRQTPATLELIPGAHTITLFMPELGSIPVKVNGSRGQKVKVSEALHGSLDVHALDSALPVKMSLDGQPQGWLPVHVDRLPPGMHEVQFSGPNMQPWGQTVNVGIRQATDVVARPMVSPATGQLQVAASINDENGTAPLAGALVFVDGESRGVTPLNLELPRGPHSLRVLFSGETAPVQVIDLPGGNRRFASFQFGLDSDLPPLRLKGSFATISANRPTVITAELEGLDVRDLRDAWLHVRSSEGLWRRYQMALRNGGDGAELSVAFPNMVFDPQGRVTWYLSASTPQGDEFFTEIQRSTR